MKTLVKGFNETNLKFINLKWEFLKFKGENEKWMTLKSEGHW